MPSKDSPAGHEFLVLGVALVIVGAFLIHCYYDRSGRAKPFLLRFLPGPS